MRPSILRTVALTLGLLVSPATQAAEVAVDYEVFGSGPTHVLVLHDWLGDRANYDPIRPYLSPDKFTYAFIDLRGYGGSKDVSGEYTSSEAAADALSVADALGWETFSIVGHSMTGMVVQRVAAFAPTRVEKIVATTPVGAKGLMVDEETYDFFATATGDPEAMAQALGLLTGNRLSPAWIAFKVDRGMKRSTEAARLAYLDMFDKEDFSADVSGLKTPVLALLGANDLGAFQPENIEATFGAWYPNLTVVVSENAGHYPMQETPPFYATTIEAFLSPEEAESTGSQ